MRFIYFNYTLMYEFWYTLEKTGFKFFFFNWPTFTKNLPKKLSRY